MHTNKAYSGYVTTKSHLHNWWRHRWFKTICISFFALTTLAVTLSLLLKFIILTPKKSTTTANITTTTTTITSTTSSATLATTTTQHLGKL
ncbi:hypothetical protein I4U23_027267 [Adineta vaga]|nr:hypothetical protein I4U23_027267 [Adineta vaga]